MHKTVQLTAIQDATTWQRPPTGREMGVTLTRLAWPCLAMPCSVLLSKKKEKKGRNRKKMKQNKSFPES